MRHRIIQHAGRRFSLKLDDTVWSNLEFLAAREGLRLNRLVARVADQAGAGANVTGALRQYCLERALERVKELERKAEDRALAAGGVPVAVIADACPSPCLVVASDHRVLRANLAAREWMGASEEALIGKSVQHYFQIKSSASLEEIVKKYADGSLAVFSARIVYVRPGRLVVARANICPGQVREDGGIAYLILVDPGRTT